MWKTVECAVQGTSHIKTNTPCQDKTYSTTFDNTQVVALADGAGSAVFSHYGAETATKHVCNLLSHNFDLYFNDENGVAVKQNLISSLNDELGETAKRLKCSIDALASTLLVVAVKREQFIIIHIGDGIIGYLREDELKIASHPQNGEFVNETVFTTSQKAILSIKLLKGNLNQISGFVLMSDGTEAGFYDKRKQRLADVLRRIIQLSMLYVHPEELQDQLQQSFKDTLCHVTQDDCSMVVLAKSDSGYLNLTTSQRKQILQVCGKDTTRINKSLKRLDDILLFLRDRHDLQQVSHHLHVRKKYTKKYIRKLYELHLIQKVGNMYRTAIIMDAREGE